MTLYRFKIKRPIVTDENNAKVDSAGTYAQLRVYLDIGRNEYEFVRTPADSTTSPITIDATGGSKITSSSETGSPEWTGSLPRTGASLPATRYLIRFDGPATLKKSTTGELLLEATITNARATELADNQGFVQLINGTPSTTILVEGNPIGSYEPDVWTTT